MRNAVLFRLLVAGAIAAVLFLAAFTCGSTAYARVGVTARESALGVIPVDAMPMSATSMNAAAVLPFGLDGVGRSGDSRITYLINNRKWFELDKELAAMSPANVTPGLYTMAKALVAHYFCRPDSACNALYELLTNYQDEIGYGNSVSMMVMLAMNFARVNQYKQAVQQLQLLLERQLLDGRDSASLSSSFAMMKRFAAYDAKGNVCRPLHKPGRYRVPFTFFSDIHRAVSRGGHSVVVGGKMRGRSVRLVLDTGAGINIISSSDAREYGLRPTDVTIPVQGVGMQTGRLAWADKLQIGGMVWQNVPFFIVDIHTGHAQTDSAGTLLPPVIGLPLMFAMGELQFDFVRRELVVPRKPAPNPLPHSNLILDDGGCLVIESSNAGTPLYLAFDTGSYFSALSSSWYFLHDEYVAAQGRSDTVTVAGIGGVARKPCYVLSRFAFALGKGGAVLDSVRVDTGAGLDGDTISVGRSSAGQYDGTAGLDMLERFKRVVLNLRYMYISGL